MQFTRERCAAPTCDTQKSLGQILAASSRRQADGGDDISRRRKLDRARLERRSMRLLLQSRQYRERVGAAAAMHVLESTSAGSRRATGSGRFFDAKA